MKLKTQYPIIATSDLAETQLFYTLLGFETVHAGDDYLQLAWPGAPSIQIGFLRRGLSTMPLAFATEYRGGMFIGLEVADVDAAYAELKAKGIDICVEIRDASWGQRHFAVMDPNGVTINIAMDLPTADAMFAQRFQAMLQHVA